MGLAKGFIRYEFELSNVWNSSLYDIFTMQEADMAVASLTITYPREQDIDFTKPYLDLGYTFIMKVINKELTCIFWLDRNDKFNVLQKIEQTVILDRYTLSHLLWIRKYVST